MQRVVIKAVGLRTRWLHGVQRASRTRKLARLQRFFVYGPAFHPRGSRLLSSAQPIVSCACHGSADDLPGIGGEPSHPFRWLVRFFLRRGGIVVIAARASSIRSLSTPLPLNPREHIRLAKAPIFPEPETRNGAHSGPSTIRTGLHIRDIARSETVNCWQRPSPSRSPDLVPSRKKGWEGQSLYLGH